MTDLFVATTGSDTTGDGTAGNPYATIVRASQAATPGTTVHVAAGTYTVTSGFTTAVSGVAGNPIVYVSAQRGAAIISATGAQGASAAIWTNTGDYVVIHGFVVTGPTYAVGIYNQGGASNVIQSNVVHDICTDPTAYSLAISSGNGGSAIAMDNFKSVAATITPASFGAHFATAGSAPSTVSGQGVPIGAVRLWDGYGGQLHWAGLETANGTYNWANFDAAVSAAASAGWTVIWSNGYTPIWENASANGNTFPNPFPPANNADFFSLISSVITRANGRIGLFEAWNEVNDAASYWNGTQSQLVTMTQNQTTQAHGVGKLSLTPSVTFPLTGCPYLVQMLNQGAGTGADAVAVHIYPHDYPDAVSGNNGHGLAEQVWQQANWWIACADAGGMSGKPVHVTEGGWFLSGTFGQILQASNQPLWGGLWPMLLLSAGCASGYFYAWDNAGTAFLYNGTSLTSAGVAYKTMTNWLNGCNWVNRASRVYGTNQIGNPQGAGVGNGNTTPPTGWSVNNPDSGRNVSYQFLGTGTQNGMSYVKWRAFTTAPVGASPSGAIQLFFCNPVTATNNQWWFCETYIALDPATVMTNGIPNGLTGGANSLDSIRLQMQDNTFSVAWNATTSTFTCASAINKSKKIIWGITGSSGVTSVQPYVWIGYNAGATFDVTLRIGIGSSVGVDGAATLDGGTVWSTDVQNPVTGLQGRVRWDMTGGPTSYNVPAPYNVFQTNLSGTKAAISGSVTLTNSPLFLTNQ